MPEKKVLDTIDSRPESCLSRHIRTNTRDLPQLPRDIAPSAYSCTIMATGRMACGLHNIRCH